MYGITFLILCMVLTLTVMLSGVGFMASSTNLYKRHGNKFMIARVVCQMCALMILCIIAVMSGR